MKATSCLKTFEWLKTSEPIVAVGPSVPSELLTRLRGALQDGVDAVPDWKRPGFYDVEIDDCWYYIHLPNHLPRVYLVAVQESLSRRERVARSAG